jgi:hypothetical protein
MTYTQLALAGVVLAVGADLFIFRTRLLGRKAFWVSYAIIVTFQLLTNGVLTGFGIVRYNGEAILGESSPAEGPPPFVGAGRLAFAPVEDLMFGFALVVLTLVLWVFLGRRGLQRTPYSGPPRRWFPGVAGAESAASDPSPVPGRSGDGQSSAESH